MYNLVRHHAGIERRLEKWMGKSQSCTIWRSASSKEDLPSCSMMAIENNAMHQ
jgi:hypothetical protein